MSCLAMRKRDKRVAPVFLFCVGATKAGTSWLYDQLRAHPDCALRTIKEYHYFSTKNAAQWSNRQIALAQEIADLSQTDNVPTSAYSAERLSDLRDWSYVIQSGQIDIDRFRSFVLDGLAGRRLVGDFTPAYSVMSAQALGALRALQPLRIVYLIRDPLARLWSHIRMNCDRDTPENFAQACETMLRRVLAGEQNGGLQGLTRRGDYRANLPKLRRIFGADLLVMFTEELMTKIGFDQLLTFLGLGPKDADLTKKVHEGRDLAFPSGLRAAALRVLRPQYDYIASEFSALPTAWRLNMNEALR